MKGYRLNKHIALANYYADTRNVANFSGYEFNPFTQGPMPVQGVNMYDAPIGPMDPREYGVRSRAVSRNKYIGQAQQMLQSPEIAARKGYNQASHYAKRGLGWAKANRVKAGLGGAAGLAALGGAGYGAYRMLQDDEY